MMENLDLQCCYKKIEFKGMQSEFGNGPVSSTLDFCFISWVFNRPFLYKIINHHQKANIVDKFITVLNNPHVSSSSIHTGAPLEFKSSIVQTPSCLLRMSLRCNGLHLQMPGPKSKDIRKKNDTQPINSQNITKYHKQKEEASRVMGT